jgi:predicted small integral membrane protein
MTVRAAKMLLVFAAAVFYSFAVFNNLTDYNSNYQFIRHVLMMDSTFPGNQGMWRALNQPALHSVSIYRSSRGRP